MIVNIKYFAALREITGKSDQAYETKATIVSELFAELNSEYQFPIEKDLLKVAINERYETFESPITDGDTIVFIPPVAGG